MSKERELRHGHFGIFESYENFFSQIFFSAIKIDLPSSHMFSQNLTKFGKSGFFERKKNLLKIFSHSSQIYQNVRAVILFILTY